MTCRLWSSLLWFAVRSAYLTFQVHDNVHFDRSFLSLLTYSLHRPPFLHLVKRHSFDSLYNVLLHMSILSEDTIKSGFCFVVGRTRLNGSRVAVFSFLLPKNFSP